MRNIKKLRGNEIRRIIRDRFFTSNQQSQDIFWTTEWCSKGSVLQIGDGKEKGLVGLIVGVFRRIRGIKPIIIPQRPETDTSGLAGPKPGDWKYTGYETDTVDVGEKNWVRFPMEGSASGYC